MVILIQNSPRIQFPLSFIKKISDELQLLNYPIRFHNFLSSQFWPQYWLRFNILLDVAYGSKCMDDVEKTRQLEAISNFAV